MTVNENKKAIFILFFLFSNLLSVTSSRTGVSPNKMHSLEQNLNLDSPLKVCDKSTLNETVNEIQQGLQSYTQVASYNWSDNFNDPTIVVPGAPKR